MNAREKLDAILEDLATKQRKAAMTNKPTMWAYYHTMRGALLLWFAETTDGATAGAALALIQISERHQNDPPSEAARWAAMAVYARRVFREWAPGRKLDKRSGTLGSLAWLRRRADEMPNVPRQTAERSGASLHADVGASACPRCHGVHWLMPLSYDEAGVPCPQCNADGKLPVGSNGSLDRGAAAAPTVGGVVGTEQQKGE